MEILEHCVRNATTNTMQSTERKLGERRCGMREIIFKAKRIDNGGWVEGWILKDEVTGQYFIHGSGNSVNESDKVNEEGCLRFVAFEVDTSTICQYTGLTDKNGQKIWEHDIVRRTDLHLTEQPSVGIIEYDVENTAFVIHWIDVVNYSPTYPWKDKIEVIGNVFDNPELLTGDVE